MGKNKISISIKSVMTLILYIICQLLARAPQGGHYYECYYYILYIPLYMFISLIGGKIIIEGY